jgi:hypothetical protein
MKLQPLAFSLFYLGSAFALHAEVCISASMPPACYLTLQVKQDLEVLGFAVQDVHAGFPQFDTSLDGRPLTTISFGYALERGLGTKLDEEIAGRIDKIATLFSKVDHRLKMSLCNALSGGQHDMFEAGERRFVNAGGIIVFDLYMYSFSDGVSSYARHELATVTITSCEAP